MWLSAFRKEKRYCMWKLKLDSRYVTEIIFVQGKCIVDSVIIVTKMDGFQPTNL